MGPPYFPLSHLATLEFPWDFSPSFVRIRSSEAAAAETYTIAQSLAEKNRADAVLQAETYYNYYGDYAAYQSAIGTADQNYAD
ncbi:MAG: hypothetical protein ABI614_25425, partial [Planctomycetota bacterium]